MLLFQNWRVQTIRDNFDRYVETLSGADTLHDTQGICWQNAELVSNVTQLPRTSTDSNSGGTRKRKWTIELPDSTLPFYHKKPRLLPNFNVNGQPRVSNPANLLSARMLDFAWLLSVTVGVKDTPMWVGFNSKILMDSTPLQKIHYLPTINKSPTSYDVVYETMKRSLTIADDCGQRLSLIHI